MALLSPSTSLTEPAAIPVCKSAATFGPHAGVKMCAQPLPERHVQNPAPGAVLNSAMPTSPERVVLAEVERLQKPIEPQVIVPILSSAEGPRCAAPCGQLACDRASRVLSCNIALVIPPGLFA
jgi:hypothetical protein